jgi:predicted small metal-binding protein
VRRIDCADFLPLGVACKHVLEGVNDEELLQQARQHTQDEHPEENFDEERVRDLIARRMG